MITFTRDWRGYAAGSTVSNLEATIEAIAVSEGAAIWGSDDDDSVWLPVPSIFRVRITGTGTVVIDSRSRMKVVSLAVAQFSANGAVDQIEFPYAGSNAVEIRFTTTGTATAEVI